MTIDHSNEGSLEHSDRPNGIDTDKPLAEASPLESQIYQQGSRASEHSSATSPEKAISAVVNRFLEHPGEAAEAMGLVGIGELMLLIFLVCISCRRSLPLSLTIAGPSRGGKSTPIKRVIQLLIPPEWVVKVGRFSAAVVSRMGTGLENRIVLIEEKCGMIEERAAYVIRSLQTDGEFIEYITGKDGRLEKLIVKGPIAKIDTTSDDLKTFKDDDLSRCIIALIDESQAQTLRILDQKAEKVAMRKKRADPTFCKAIMDYILSIGQQQDLEVYIPYSKHIYPKVIAQQDRRDIDKLHALIEVVAWLRQFDKKIFRDEQGQYIEADLRDYELIYPIAEKAYQAMRTDSKIFDSQVEDLEKALQQRKVKTFNVRELGDATGVGKSQAANLAKKLVENELAVKTSKSSSSVGAIYELVKTQRAGGILVTPEELRVKLSE